MDKYKNKFRNSSARLQSWDYGSNAAYFITICTAGREPYFGEILFSKQMKLSEIGQHVQKCWTDIPSHFPFVLLDAFVVMPDHIHGIIIIDKPNIIDNMSGTIGDALGTQYFASLQLLNQQPNQPLKSKNKFGSQSQNLASIIRGFKIGITKYARLNKMEFGWQPRYYDHVIRNRTELDRIRNYIKTNPMNWENEK